MSGLADRIRYALANPLRSVGSDSAYIASVLDAIPGPVVLVGHSYGGMVITNTAALTTNRSIQALVYVAAFIPEVNASHAVLVSHPDAVADLINSATRSFAVATP